MSQRNLRKLYGAASIPPPSDSSEDEYEPPYATNNTKRTYEGLEVSTNSESEKNPSEDEESVSESESEPESESEKAKPSKQNAPSDDLDEVDKSVREVNALLGEPPNAPAAASKPKPDIRAVLFSVQYKTLNPRDELYRLFGPDAEERAGKKKGRQPHYRRIQKKALIMQEYKFKGSGLSMVLDRVEEGISYFAFNHSREYQRRHRIFLLKLLDRAPYVAAPNGDAYKYMHVEALLQTTELMFRLGNNNGAGDLIEQLVAYMQRMFHSSFNLTDLKVRLEYKFVENRPFHILMLKHLHVLSNRACHRTALEIAKLLLNLDPSDPLAVVFIIDTLAIRAREYQWLVETIDYLDKDRHAGFLFNMKFSYALAHFHLALQGKVHLQTANRLLQSAIIAFPWVVKELIDYVKHNTDDIVRTHRLFNAYATSSSCMKLKELCRLYVAFTGSWWAETPVFAWVMRNARELMNKYETDATVRADIEGMVEVRNTLFPSVPREVKRHLFTIKNMSKLLVDGAVPDVDSTYSFDPYPPVNGANFYKYGLTRAVAYMQFHLNNAIITDFFASINPNYEMPSADEMLANYLRRRIIQQRDNVVNEDEDTGFEESEEDTDTEGEDNDGELDSDDDYPNANPRDPLLHYYIEDELD